MKTKMVIDNREFESKNADYFNRLDPLTGDLASSCAVAGKDDALFAVESCARAFESWSQVPHIERRQLLLKTADIIEAKTGQFIDTMKREIGASELWAGFNVYLAANLFREAASLTSQIQGETIPSSKPDTLSFTIRQPVGVCLSMVPWNGPVVLAARAMAYPLACGNTVVLKASETSPQTHKLLVDSLIEAGMPEGVLNSIMIDPKDAGPVTEALIAHPDITRVNFTGSTHVGRIVAETSAKYLKRCLLELGDKSPLIALDDADVEGAVAAAVFGSLIYQGQICMSTERIIVDDKIADQFIEAFIRRADDMLVASPLESPDCVVGPVISQASSDRLNRLIQDAENKGARILSGGTSDSALRKPTIIDGVTREMDIYHEETFGPVITILRAKDTSEAIKMANDTDFGLSAAVFGKDVVRALDVAKKIKTGSCHINGSTVQNDAQAPYGGVKASGYGRFDGRAVIDEFTELKWLTIENSSQQYPF